MICYYNYYKTNRKKNTFNKKNFKSQFDDFYRTLYWLLINSELRIFTIFYNKYLYTLYKMYQEGIEKVYNKYNNYDIR